MGMMAASASVKAAVLIGISLLLLIPLGLLAGLVAERTIQRDAAVASVARGWGDRQWVGGPVLAIPVTDGGSPSRTVDWYVLPESLEITAALEVQDTPRRLGLYDVPVYIARVHVTGAFNIAAAMAVLAHDGGTAARVHPEQARLLLPIKDPRGLRELVSGNEPLHFQPESGFPLSVMAVPLDLSATAARTFDLSFRLAGTQSLNFLPLGKVVHVQLQGNWPDPGFTDGFLPTERKLEGNRFTASWQVLDVNRTYGNHWSADRNSEQGLLASGFGVELVQPVDIYQRCTRAVKYGGLFIALSILTLFLVENLRRRAIHPIQYGLMGLALSIFYLLLLALAEHIGFLAAYLLATTALCVLMGVYLAAALRSRLGGAASAGCFAATYALLYLLITSESYALLAGAITLFTLLTAAMLLTRRIDWYTREVSQGDIRP
ncbi:MAG: cell envelope integrity protein CreD [Proteobacteria bacterium]|nr:cell envelope integrity protein CreD [Pseudomonadota bacterium]